MAFAVSEMGITPVELLSHRRASHLVAARALYVWIVKTYGPDFLSYRTIGEWLGQRDHSTIVHLWKEVAPRLRRLDPDFLLLCDRFTEQVAKELEVPQCH